ncbi:MAG: DNA repair protein RecN [Bdellovibrionaceae bacterium]|nr:DNA repair protein RecN [Pseudobdellovibrionaceae bacterium]
MLQELKVSQFAIIDSLHIEFQNGLNILSGETGSGKSVLLKSLALLMGEKASSDTIRTGCTQATVEGVFNLRDRPDLTEKLMELGIDIEDNKLIVRRIISAGDKSKVFLNGSLSPLSQLRDFIAPLIEVTGHSAPLIEMTGQHDNRNLLSKQYHLDLVDQYSGVWDKRHSFDRQYQEYTQLNEKIANFEKNFSLKNERLDFLKFQSKEFNNLNLDLEKDSQLETEIKLLKNSSKVVQFSNLCDQIVYQDDDSVTARLKTLLKKSVELGNIDANIAEKIQGLNQAMTLIDETVYSLQNYTKKIDSDPSSLEEKESRLSQIRKLQKKHGDDLTQLATHFENMETEIIELENAEVHVEKMKKQAAVLQTELKKKADELHKVRLSKCVQLAQKVNAQLLDLNMKGVTFDIQVNSLNHLTATGNSEVEFLSQTSLKDPKRPLAKVSSGGELSRILLALKTAVGKINSLQDLPRTYLFDEVDTGVSGNTAEKVGKKLKEIAKGQQVICVTHLPQVAACGDVHFSIQKTTKEDQAEMTVVELNRKSRVEEIAKLISGEKISKTSLAHAEQLLKENSL